ncbi:TRAP transporter small permease subunit [Rhodobacteraceae bacterium 2376]|uniref:TRAP transporter small permease protein n=1 Tax=Rhabdonatronobacter sediminivivens TaxID=2743469 RepID=A0A7Z0HZJ0_9RHOB|nr:TRAP transporter small permease subunit [Rhabdonatronobacter sediminivivens]NYS24902.1 TRAP transporter small permease subunit [Rhabdonatronobacter sediminivivens]
MPHSTPATGIGPILLRLLAWGTVTITFAFLIENYLVHWRGQPGAMAFVQGQTDGLLSAVLYVVAAVLAVALVYRSRNEPFRTDSARIEALTNYLVRACFFAVLFVGLGDTAVSWLRAEGLHRVLFSDEMATALGQTRFRGPMIHVPLMVLGFVVAAFTRTLGFFWLALLVVLVQLLMVIGRFIFSYEQPFMADLVRMWYAALFLFASAYTLATDGHVRVDVFYSSMSRKGRALVNGLGAVVLGMTMCWTILILGTATSASTLIGPFLRFEQGQQTYGLMTKYTLAVFLGIFAVTMLFQFAAYVLGAAASWRDEFDPNAPPEGAAADVKLAAG